MRKNFAFGFLFAIIAVTTSSCGLFRHKGERCPAYTQELPTEKADQDVALLR